MGGEVCVAVGGAVGATPVVVPVVDVKFEVKVLCGIEAAAVDEAKEALEVAPLDGSDELLTILKTVDMKPYFDGPFVALKIAM